MKNKDDLTVKKLTLTILHIIAYFVCMIVFAIAGVASVIAMCAFAFSLHWVYLVILAICLPLCGLARLVLSTNP